MNTSLTSWTVNFVRGTAALMFLAGQNLMAQSPAPDDFNPGAGSESYFQTFNAMAVQPDGKVLVGGDFGLLDGQLRSYLGRLHADGTLDTSFDTELNGGVFSLAVQADAKILVAGLFTAVDGQPRSGLGRLNANGMVDATFNPQPNGPVYALAVQADGKVLVGGDFTSVGGVARSCLARLNTNGTLDTAFNPGANGAVWAFALQADGKIVTGGEFTTLGGQARTNLARLNAAGTLDTTFNAALDGPAYTLAVQPDGKVLVSGGFSTLGGQPRTGLGRVNTNGAVDVAFDPGAEGSVFTFALQADGKILAGGNFTMLDGQLRSFLGRLNADGTLDAGFNPEPDLPVITLAVQADGKTLVGGAFTLLGGQDRYSIGRLDNTDPAVQQLSHAGTTATWLRSGSGPEFWRTSFDYSTNGTTWTSLGTGVRIAGGWQRTPATLPAGATLRARGHVSSGREGCDWVVEQHLGKLVLASQPASITNGFGTTAAFSAQIGGTEPISYQWLSNGVPMVNGGEISGANTPLLSIDLVSKSNEAGYRLVAGNSFGSVTSAVASLTVLDPFIMLPPMDADVDVGSPWTFNVQAAGTSPLGYQWLLEGAPIPGAVNASLDLPAVSNSNAGFYSVVVSNVQGSVTSPPAMLFVIPPPLDASFSASTDGRVYSIAVQPDGKIVVGGDFTSLAGKMRYGIGRLNPDSSVDESFNPIVNGTIYSLALQTNGALVVVGEFNNVGGLTRNNIARINPNGAVDAAFNPNANRPVSAVVVQADGKILIGGEFETIGGADRYYIARLTTAGALDALDPDPDWFVRILAPQSDGKILVGGEFTAIAGQLRSGLARLSSAGGGDAAFNSALPDELYGGEVVVNALAVQADGKILDSNIRLNTNGTLDAAFELTVDGPVSSIAIQTDGKILFGGDFFNLNGLPAPRIGRVNPDASPDFTFNPPFVGSSPVMTVQPDGKVLVGAQNGIYRLNATTPAVQSLTYSGTTATWLRSGTGPEVWRTTFEHSADGVTWTGLGAGTRIAGGWQRTGVTLPAGRTLRASGQVAGDAFGSGWFVMSYYGRPVFVTQPASSTNNYLSDVKITGIVAGSGPLSYWWLKDGLVVTNLPNGAGYASNTLTLSDVTKVVQGAYRLVVSNSFGSVTSSVANLIVQEPAIVSAPVSTGSSPGGSASFSGLAIGTPPIFYQWINNGLPVPGATNTSVTLSNLAVGNAGTVALVASNIYGSVTSAPAYLTVSGAAFESAFTGTVNGNVYATAVQGDGKILVGGSFTTFRGLPRQRIVRVHPDGLPDDSFLGGVSNGYVNCLTLQPDGKILVGGAFTSVSGALRTNLCRLNPDGTPDASFNPGAATPSGGGYVNTIVLQPNGQIVVAGYFSVLAGQARYSIGRLNTNGTLDTVFNAWAGFIFVEPIYTLALQTDGKILVGGAFQHLNDEQRYNIGRLNANGTLDLAFNPGANSEVLSLALLGDGKMLVGGWFSEVGGQLRGPLARLNANGTVDTNFNVTFGNTSSSSIYVNSVAQQVDGKILVGGSFNRLDGLTRSFFGRLNTNGTPDLTFNVAFSAAVNGVTVQPDGKVLVARNGIYRLTNTAPAIESLSFVGTTIDWLRSGTGPEVSHAMFEYSTNGTTWTSLGFGTRLTNGWRKTSVPAQPASGIVRARGWVRGADSTGSGWFAEKRLYRGKPVILTQPQSRTNLTGTVAWFSVLAEGTAPLSYRWRSNGVSLAEGGKWSGTLSNLLTLNAAQLGDAAAYNVIITNASGSITSSVASLTVVALDGYGTITPQLLGSGSLQLRYVGLPGTGYILERSFNLSPPVTWVPQRTNAAGIDGVLMFTNTPVASTNNFWRIRSMP
jgi:uncharacterized delta-60 repeat protein